MNSNTSHNSLRPFGWCVVLLLISTQSWGQECISGNCVNGQGTYIFADGDKYVGEYRDNKQHGQGTYTWANGAKYVGEFKDNKKNGQGTYTWTYGSLRRVLSAAEVQRLYDFGLDAEDNGIRKLLPGELEKALEEIKKFEEDYIKSSAWGVEDVKRSGQPDGTKYVGKWKDDQKHGQGTFTWADGRKYVGEFKDGKLHGQGTYTWANGRVKRTIWEKGKLIETFEDKSRRDRIFNACIIDKSNALDMSVVLVAKAVNDTCTEISKNPSWLDRLRYD
jgi:hypothetical protein